MPSRACLTCRINWPIDRDNPVDCPRCGGDTQLHNVKPDVSVNEARFERVYRAHELEREERGELSPDVAGRLEARELLQRTRKG